MSTNTKGTIFDDVFRTMVQKMPRLMIPLINEAFGEHYSKQERITQLRNEHEEMFGKIITDSILLLGGKTYHIECQSVDDTTMAIRMVQYDFSIALEQAVKCDRMYELNFPETCVLYLRSTPATPDSLQVKVNFPNGQSATYEAKTMKLSSYAKQEILAKHLHCLLPYYALKFEKQKASINNDPKLLEDLLSDYKDFQEELGIYFMAEGSPSTYADLVKLTLRLIDYIFASEDHIKEGVKSIMGGEILQLESERLMELGMERGLEVYITDKIEDGYTKDQIINKLITKFQLSPENAEKYYAKYATAPIA